MSLKSIWLMTLCLAMSAGIAYVRPALAFQTSGFQESLVTGGLSLPTAMQFAPDGRIFVCEKSGHLRVIKNGVLQPADFLTVSVDTENERGLLGIAFDPAFATNRFVYVYYTSSIAPIKNRVSRFTASSVNPDIAEPNSELLLLDNVAPEGGSHNGGALHFGLDGKLYIGVGDGDLSPSSQLLSSLLGKLLRINPNGSIPSDNPFVGVPGARGEIWALGLRNPYTFAIDPVSGKIHINDVGSNAFEEINVGVAGGNYGWPVCEGVCGNPSYIDPIHVYPHSGSSAAITGGAFYRGGQFPSLYTGSYFFSDYRRGWIRRLDTNNQMTSFWDFLNTPVDLKVGPDGALYYLSLLGGQVRKIVSTTIQAKRVRAQVTSQ